jgi:hypothetical protein
MSHQGYLLTVLLIEADIISSRLFPFVLWSCNKLSVVNSSHLCALGLKLFSIISHDLVLS